MILCSLIWRIWGRELCYPQISPVTEGEGGAGVKSKIRVVGAVISPYRCLVGAVSLRVFLVREIAVVTHQEKGLGGFRGLLSVLARCWVRKAQSTNHSPKWHTSDCQCLVILPVSHAHSNTIKLTVSQLHCLEHILCVTQFVLESNCKQCIQQEKQLMTNSVQFLCIFPVHCWASPFNDIRIYILALYLYSGYKQPALDHITHRTRFLKYRTSSSAVNIILVIFALSTCVLVPFREYYCKSIFSPPRGRYVNLMMLAKCVWSGYCIDYIVTLPDTQAQRPRDLQRTAIHLDAGYHSTLLRLCSRENHAGKKLLWIPQGSTSEVCVFVNLFQDYRKKWMFGCCSCCGSSSLICENCS